MSFSPQAFCVPALGQWIQEIIAHISVSKELSHQWEINGDFLSFVCYKYSQEQMGCMDCRHNDHLTFMLYIFRFMVWTGWPSTCQSINDQSNQKNIHLSAPKLEAVKGYQFN